MNCSDILKAQQKCKFVQNYDPQCTCETISVSNDSPKIVEDEERLIRQIYSPIHIDEETGNIKPLAFNDVKDKGMSVNRKTYCSKEELLRKIQSKLNLDKKRGKDRTFFGAIQAICHDIRSIKTDDDRRAFCVYDTANKNNVSHADICQAFSGRVQESKVRAKLRKIFSKTPVGLDDLFEN
ncbi:MULTISPECIES: hypothetical protein [Spirulina sp. CCY15215]|uniref:hypothetical protein n=1 Tax=Spirulina sp. CCY15215 TaxID=2767591 RepID=UPI0019504C8A|nr:hypothetical protein [Spirulina major]